MNEHDKARPVSGEIMTGDQMQRAAAQPADFSDAEYETVGAEREAPLSRFTEAKAATGMDFLKPGHAGTASGRPRGHGGPIFWILGLTLVALAFWVSGGHALVRRAAILTPAETLQPLRIADVRSRVENHNGRDVLFVDGRAENHGMEPLALPPIGISVVANDGKVTRYFLGTNGSELAPGDRYSFSSRLEAPTNGVKTVSVTFRETAR